MRGRFPTTHIYARLNSCLKFFVMKKKDAEKLAKISGSDIIIRADSI